MRIFAALGGFDRGLYVEKWAPFVKVNEDILFSLFFSFSICIYSWLYVFLYPAIWQTKFNLGHMIKFATYISKNSLECLLTTIKLVWFTRIICQHVFIIRFDHPMYAPKFSPLWFDNCFFDIHMIICIIYSKYKVSLQPKLEEIPPN